MSYKPPKTIVNHAGVDECVSGEMGGSDYKHDVFLKDGWFFSIGRMEGCQGGMFHTVKDFLSAEPMKKE